MLIVSLSLIKITFFLSVIIHIVLAVFSVRYAQLDLASDFSIVEMASWFEVEYGDEF